MKNSFYFFFTGQIHFIVYITIIAEQIVNATNSVESKIEYFKES